MPAKKSAKKKKTEAEAILDPVKDARERFHDEYTLHASCGLHETTGAWHTTGEFGSLDQGYLRHCGPTAIVNLLCTAEKSHPLHQGKRLIPQRAFRRIARLGSEKHYYQNRDVLHFFGGTFNFATRAYIRAVLQLYGYQGIRVGHLKPSWPVLMKRALDKGALLYLETVLHPRYGNHHLLAYGYRELVNDKGKKKLYLLTADGWSDRPRYLSADDLKTGAFLAVTIGADDTGKDQPADTDTVTKAKIRNGDTTMHDTDVIGTETAQPRASEDTWHTYREKMNGAVTRWLTDTVNEGNLQIDQAIRLHYAYALPAHPKGAIVISHGFCEFFGKYHELCYDFCRAGYAVFFVEHRGHGHSSRETDNPETVHVDSFDDYVSDFKRFYDGIVLPHSANLKHFLFAHSMGGAIGALYLERYPQDFDAAVLDAPMLEIGFGGLPVVLVKAALLKSRILGQEKVFAPGNHGFVPQFTPPNNPHYDEERQRFQFDLRVKDGMCRSSGASNGWVRAAIRGMDEALENASKVETPTTLLQMEEDEWVLPGAQDQFVQSAQNVHKEYLSDSPHEVFNTHDEQRDAYIKRVLDIFDTIR